MVRFIASTALYVTTHWLVHNMYCDSVLQMSKLRGVARSIHLPRAQTVLRNIVWSPWEVVSMVRSIAIDCIVCYHPLVGTQHVL